MYQYKIVKIFLEQYQSQYPNIFETKNIQNSKIQNFFDQKLSTIDNNNCQLLFDDYTTNLYELILIHGNTEQVKKTIEIVNDNYKKIFIHNNSKKNRPNYYSEIFQNIIVHAPIENILVLLSTEKHLFNYIDGRFMFYLLDSHFNKSKDKFSELISNHTFREAIKKNTNTILRYALSYNENIFYSLEKNFSIFENGIFNTKNTQKYIHAFFEYFYPLNTSKKFQQENILGLLSGLSRKDETHEFSDDELITKIYNVEKNIINCQRLGILSQSTINKYLNNILNNTELNLDVKNILEKMIINQSMLNFSNYVVPNMPNKKTKLKL